LRSRTFVSLDGVDFRILEQSPFDRKWFSHKFKGPGLRYEVGLNIRTGEVVWCNGGVPCGDWPDLKLARSKYVNFVGEDELTIADKGYKDQRYFAYNNSMLVKKILARHETVNSRLKNFKVLSDRFRHNLTFHKYCFHAVANIVQMMDIEDGQSLFKINYLYDIEDGQSLFKINYLS